MTRGRLSTKRPVSLYLSFDLTASLDKLAAAQNQSISSLVESVLTQYVQYQNENPPAVDPVEQIEEPNVKLGIPRDINEVESLAMFASTDMSTYFKFAEQLGRVIS